MSNSRFVLTPEEDENSINASLGFEVSVMQWLIVFVAVCFGLLVGRFLNWLSGALMQAMEIQWEQDRQSSEILESQPGLLILIWRQRTACGSWLASWPFSPSSIAMSLASGALIGVGAALPPSLSTLALLPVGLLMLLMVRIDSEHFILPDVLVYTLLWSGLLWAALSYAEPEKAIIAAMGAYIGLYVVAEGYSALRGIKMMGHGDYKLFAALAAWLDYAMIPAMLLAAALITIVLWLVYYRKKDTAEIPFGPALIIAGAALMILKQPWAQF